MARAFPQSQPQDYGQPPRPGEWQDLRSELVALLDQVETQVARTSRPETGYLGLAERMRDLRHQVAEVEPESRHREALRSVQRAIDRFSDRGEVGYPPNPRDTLESAIQQIRTRHFDSRPTEVPIAAPPRIELPRFDDLALAVSGVSGRLERLESELKTQARGQTSNIKEIADQVGQLSHVVELLAGAVGETGQVKRLETQIASLARLVTQGPQVDLSTINKRLDDVSLTVGKLAELQKHYADRADTTGMAERLDDVTATVGRLADLQVQFANKVDNPKDREIFAEGMRAIEDGVRNVYDRIDVIEKSVAMAPADLEKVTEEMARFTAAMHNPQQPRGLIELIDALNTRVGDIENRSAEVGGLKTDIEELRNAVVEAMEPRFTALELQIEALADKVAERPAEINVSQLEAQVRQLVARMDQTGEQLTGLTRLYSQPLEREPGPVLDEAGFAEIEKRVSKVMQAAARDTAPDEMAGLQTTIREVNERLARLEGSLTAPRSAEKLAAPVLATPPPLKSFDDPIAPIIAALTSGGQVPVVEAASPPAPVLRGDAMPKNPGEDAPLVDRPFGDSAPIRNALEARNGPRRHHPGLVPGPAETAELPPAPTPSLGFGPQAEAGPAEPQRHGFDPASAERPPSPKSSLDAPEREAFAAASMPPPPIHSYPTDPGVAPSRSTFIEAHRRAARQPTAAKAGAAAPSTLIERAFARFQTVKATPAPAAVKVAKANKEAPPRTGRKLAGDREAPTQWQPDEAEPRALAPEPEPTPVALGAVAGNPAPDPRGGKPESLLMRYRKPLLLGGSLIVIACLAINLINQRLADKATVAATSEPVVLQSGDAALMPTPMAEQRIETVAASTAPRVVPIIESLSTGSVDPSAARGFMPASAMPAMPLAFAVAAEGPAVGPAVGAAAAAIEFASLDPLADSVVPLPEALESPVQVELPAAGIGPDELRRAAADGDARAQFEIAEIYTEGRAVPKNLAEAAIWYERAATQGFAPAQYRLGNLYESGKGVALDFDEAKLWYQRAAEAGNRMAMHNLAALYAGGEAGKQQFDAAAQWFEEAANRGMKDSQFNLGMLYARGLGVKQSLESSYKWFSLAARNGDADAAKARDDIAASVDVATMQRLKEDVAAWTATPIDLAANFAPIGTWAKAFDPGTTITKPGVVLRVQRALVLLGYDVGTPDGMAGPKTAEAIKAFERGTGMSEVGAINPRLLAVLGSQPG